MFATPIGRLRFVSVLEGWSFLSLLFVAMPLKYAAGRPAAVQIVGLAHGVLWVLMLAAVADAAWRHRWGFGRVAAAVLASVVPGGPFWLEWKLRGWGDPRQPASRPSQYSSVFNSNGFSSGRRLSSRAATPVRCGVAQLVAGSRANGPR